jgi:hypothetical protein
MQLKFRKLNSELDINSKIFVFCFYSTPCMSKRRYNALCKTSVTFTIKNKRPYGKASYFFVVIFNVYYAARSTSISFSLLEIISLRIAFALLYCDLLVLSLIPRYSAISLCDKPSTAYNLKTVR